MGAMENLCIKGYPVCLSVAVFPAFILIHSQLTKYPNPGFDINRVKNYIVSPKYVFHARQTQEIK